MDAREKLQTGLAKAFADNSKLGQMYEAFSAQRVIPGEYDPVSGTSGTTLNYTGSYWRDAFTFAELETLDLDSADLKIGMLANATDEMPKVDDTITLASGIKARVTAVEPDPLQATYSVRLRVN